MICQSGCEPDDQPASLDWASRLSFALAFGQFGVLLLLNHGAVPSTQNGGIIVSEIDRSAENYYQRSG